MVKKSFGLVMLVAVLAFGMAVTGCDNNGGTSISPIDGRWVNSEYPEEVWVIGNGTIRAYLDGVLEMTATFTISGSNLTIRAGGETNTRTFTLSPDGNTLTFTVAWGTEVWYRQQYPSVSPIDGRWVNSEYPEEVWVIGNGTIRMYWDGVLEMTATFIISGNNITIRASGGTNTGTFTLSTDGNTLTLVEEVWHRQ